MFQAIQLDFAPVPVNEKFFSTFDATETYVLTDCELRHCYRPNLSFFNSSIPASLYSPGSRPKIRLDKNDVNTGYWFLNKTIGDANTNILRVLYREQIFQSDIGIQRFS